VNSSGPDIHDIRAPYLIPPDWRLPALIAAATLLVLALCWWGWRRMLARRPQPTLLQRTLQQAHEQALGEFLKFCDLAKFARWPLDGQQMQGMLASARHFVESTAGPVAAPTVMVPEAVHVPIRQS
jgi:hypothetical protein